MESQGRQCQLQGPLLAIWPLFVQEVPGRRLEIWSLQNKIITEKVPFNCARGSKGSIGELDVSPSGHRILLTGHPRPVIMERVGANSWRCRESKGWHSATAGLSADTVGAFIDDNRVCIGTSPYRAGNTDAFVRVYNLKTADVEQLAMLSGVKNLVGIACSENGRFAALQYWDQQDRLMTIAWDSLAGQSRSCPPKRAFMLLVAYPCLVPTISTSQWERYQNVVLRSGGTPRDKSSIWSRYFGKRVEGLYDANGKLLPRTMKGGKRFGGARLKASNWFARPRVIERRRNAALKKERIKIGCQRCLQNTRRRRDWASWDVE